MRGILYVVVASVLFGFGPSVQKFVIQGGVPAECSTFYSQIITCLLSLLIVWKNRCSLKVTPLQLAHLVTSGILGMGATSFLLNSATLYVPVGLATMLHFLYPTIVSVVMAVFFHQRLTKIKLAAVVCSICGMPLIAGLGGGEIIRPYGIFLALASALTYSFYVVSNEKGTINRLPLATKLFYASLGSMICFGGFTAANRAFALPPTAQIAGLLLVYGIFYMSAFFLFSAGIGQIGASTASFINMLEPITSVVAGMVVYKETLSPLMALGTVLILLSICLSATDGGAPQTEPRE